VIKPRFTAEVVSGAHMGIPNLAIYGATKGAVASMVYTWALELAGSGVRVNALSPFGATRIAFPDRRAPILDEMAKRLALLPPPEANSPVVEYLPFGPRQECERTAAGAHAAAFIALIPASLRLYVGLGSATEDGDSFPLTDGGDLPADLMFRIPKLLE
jgi:NAD(P)-dependent dehydrogenase (short-subunit alcohol dehydrogenase family)